MTAATGTALRGRVLESPYTWSTLGLQRNGCWRAVADEGTSSDSYGRGRRASAARRPLARRSRALTCYRAIRQLRSNVPGLFRVNVNADSWVTEI